MSEVTRMAYRYDMDPVVTLFSVVESVEQPNLAALHRHFGIQGVGP